MLDQLGLADALAQQCFACRSTVSYDREGKEVNGKNRACWAFMEDMNDSTVWDFALVLRQRYQEEVFRQALREKGVMLEAPLKLVDIAVDEAAVNGGYKVTATLQDGLTGACHTVKCKYLVGADGGRSFVRRALQIPFEGSSTEDKWVRIDGLIETNLPKPRAYCSIESPTHGNVLWAPLDRGATRIGFAFTPERQNAYSIFDEAAAVKEAIAAVKPFSLSFKEVHWFTIYSVGQRVARSFFVKDCVFLAGDACHTHSSGAAQGMNTGIHDAVNLGWKLSLVLQGVVRPEVLLPSYERERRPNVMKLIAYDRDIARLMTMQLPEEWTGDPGADPNEVLGQVMAEAASFTSGLSICYERDGVLNVAGSFKPVKLGPGPGERAPDVELQKPGTFETTRLHQETPNRARFYAVVFVGDPVHTSQLIPRIFSSVRNSSYISDPQLPLSWSTIIAGNTGPSAYELLGGTEPLGRVFFDKAGTAHARYGIDTRKGAVVVLRPDGWVGTVARLEEGVVGEVEAYFRGFMMHDIGKI